MVCHPLGQGSTSGTIVDGARMAPLSQEDRDRILSALDAPDSIEGGSSVLKFDNGVAYDGELSNGRFHGTGTIVFPEGTVEAVWAHGVASDPVVTFHDGLRFHDDVSWDYCTEDDQRFQSEITDPLLLQDPVRLRNDGGPAAIPQGTYDIGTGFLDIGKDAVFTYDGKLIEKPSEALRQWAVANCYVATGAQYS